MPRPHGTPCWLDLGVNDVATSSAFFTQLFGWTLEDQAPQPGHYALIRSGDALVGGFMDMGGHTDPDGAPIPSAVHLYLAVDDIDAAYAKALALGGTGVIAPSDADALGRFAWLLDPTGATIQLWQAGSLEGFDTPGTAGTPVWYELMTQDYDAAVAFYRDAFGFDIVPMAGAEEGDMRYATNGAGDGASSGICDASSFLPTEVGSFWRVYFAVDDCDAAAGRARELGGTVVDGPFDSPFGKLATVASPEGAQFQIIDQSRRVA